MIVMNSKAVRRLAGRIGDAELMASLQVVCRNHAIRTAEIRGIGYLRSAVLAVYDAGSDTFVTAEEPTPAAQILSLLGNVSREGDNLSLHLQVMLLIGEGADQRVVGGRLLGADVVDLEFFVDCIDDFAFVRAPGSAGLAPWLQIDSAHHTPQDEPDTPRVDFLPGRLGARPEDGEQEYELHEGDALQHPRLGACVVLDVPDEDRASIKLKSGRIVELHLGLLKLKRERRDADGRQHFVVQIRRRN